jgi:hypothetical protein
MAQSASLPGASWPLWILGPWQDWLLFIGTPALILPLVLLARTRVRIEDLAFFVASFGAVGALRRCAALPRGMCVSGISQE